MTTPGRELIAQYLEQAISAEKDLEAKLLDFAAEIGTDDQEVQASFAAQAGESAAHRDLLSVRLQEAGLDVRPSLYGPAFMLDLAPQLASNSAIVEERILQNLLSAYTMMTGECAMYEAFSTVAQAAGDDPTFFLARQIQAQKQQAAQILAHFLPSRSKIALNMLTVSEVDPAIDTKAAGDRLLQS